MTFDDDVAMIQLGQYVVALPLKQNGLEWPGPEYMDISEPGRPPFYVHRREHSLTTDDEHGAIPPMLRMPRAAFYHVLHPTSDKPH